jgi:hypothetical protein
MHRWTRWTFPTLTITLFFVLFSDFNLIYLLTRRTCIRNGLRDFSVILYNLSNLCAECKDRAVHRVRWLLRETCWELLVLVGDILLWTRGHTLKTWIALEITVLEGVNCPWHWLK